MKKILSIALVHHPMRGRRDGETITTSVTNLDIHDLARIGRTYGVASVFVVTPISAQQKLVEYIYDYWRHGTGARYNPDRAEAFSVIQTKPHIEECCLTIEKHTGMRPLLVGTTAKRCQNAINFADLRQRVAKDDTPVLLCFGTGHGFTDDFLRSCDFILEPIQSPADYNHLPVRSAVAIILDRILGRLD